MGKSKSKNKNTILFDDYGIIVACDNNGRTFVIDSIDRDLLDRYWGLVPRNEFYYYPLHSQMINNVRHKERLHRVISARLNNGVPFKIVDHINSDPTDCRRKNIRECTTLQNSRNKTSHRNSTSKYKNVCWVKNIDKWNVHVWANGKSTFGGYFKDEIEAAHAADKLMIKLHGEFAKLNFPI